MSSLWCLKPKHSPEGSRSMSATKSEQPNVQALVEDESTSTASEPTKSVQQDDTKEKSASKAITECPTCHCKMTCPNCESTANEICLPGSEDEKSAPSQSEIREDSQNDICSTDILAKETKLVSKDTQTDETNFIDDSNGTTKEVRLVNIGIQPTEFVNDPRSITTQDPPSKKLVNSNTRTAERTELATDSKITPKKEEMVHPLSHTCSGKEEESSISILITGRSGTSKSVIINGLLGQYLIRERTGVERKPRSEKLEHDADTIKNIRVEVWSSPHLQDNDKNLNRESYLDHLKKKCFHVDLIIYTLKMDETRFIQGNPDSKAMVELTKTLGENCWKKTIFVMTHANVVASNICCTVEDDTNDSQKVAFENSLATWKGIIENTLKKDAGVKYELDVTVVPAGHYNKLKLPDREDWLSALWVDCCNLMPTEAQKALIELNSSRISKIPFVSHAAATRGTTIHERPIVLSLVSKLGILIKEFFIAE